MTQPSVIAVEALPTSGALVYWRLCGAVDVVPLRAEWAAAGLDEKLMPETPAPSTALSRAMRGLAGGRKLVRPLDRRAGQALVAEAASGDDLRYGVELRTKLDPAGRPTFDPPDHPLAARVRADYDRHLSECSTEDVGLWLVKLVRHLDGLALRDTGGFYYLPPFRVPQWDRMIECLHEVSEHRVFKIPALRSTDAIEAILDAVEQEARAEAEQMERELVEGVGGKPLGERALQTRYERCESVEGKVGRYEALLGRRLDGLRERITALRANLAAAAFKAEGGSESLAAI